MSFRYKLPLVLSYVNPLISLIFPLIIMGQLFSFQSNFGPWNSKNYVIYLFIGYNILLFQRIISDIPQRFRSEKIMLTLQALMIAPFNRFNLLMGYILSHIIEVSLPFSVFIVICYFFYPISIITLITVIGLFFLILTTFSGLGLIIGVFAISKETYAKPVSLTFQFLFMFSCVSYPYQIFPYFIQLVVNINPIYYIIDLVRLTWIENDIGCSFTSHAINLVIILSMATILPTIGILMFNFIFKKYGITGY